jgi:hypothetical protein
MLSDENPWEHWAKAKSLRAILLAAVFCLCGAMTAHANLVIVPTFDSTITSDPNAATIENTITNLIAFYQASFADNITVTITFKEMTSGLGMSETYYKPGVSYSSYRSKLVARATTVNDGIALAHLPNTTTNPVNGSSTMAIYFANGRALGFSGNWNPPSGHTDSTISLNTALLNLSRASIDPSKYDLYAVTAHEIDEALGLNSALDNLSNGASAPAGDIGVLDLFRYDENGNRSFNTDPAAQAYFSLDGTIWLERFNQDDQGDFHDWYSPGGQTAHIQDAFAQPGTTPDFNVELVALDVIGYHYLVPALTLTSAGNGWETLSWSPNTPGFALQENTNLLSANWLNCVSGTNNPVTVTNTAAVKFYRIFHP